MSSTNSTLAWRDAESGAAARLSATTASLSATRQIDNRRDRSTHDGNANRRRVGRIGMEVVQMDLLGPQDLADHAANRPCRVPRQQDQADTVGNCLTVVVLAQENDSGGYAVDRDIESFANAFELVAICHDEPADHGRRDRDRLAIGLPQQQDGLALRGALPGDLQASSRHQSRNVLERLSAIPSAFKMSATLPSPRIVAPE